MELTLEQALQKGVEAHKAGQIQEADRYYTAILTAQPKHPDANHNMGVLAVGVDKVEVALPFFKTALEAKPGIAQFWLSYIDALIKLGKLSEAKAVLVQAKSKGLKGSSFDKLDKTLGSSDTIKSNFQDPSKEQLEKLFELYGQQKLQQVLDETQILTKKYSQSLTLWNLMGASAAKLGQSEEAVLAFQKALALRPDFAEGYNNMGVVLKNQGKLEEAATAYREAISIKPDYAEAYNNMGVVLREHGKLTEAIESYRTAISIKPDYFEAYNNMGIALKDQGKLEEAINAYSKTHLLNPDYAEAYLNMGNVLKAQGKLGEAIEAYNKALDKKAHYAEAHINMGVVFKEHGKLDEALRAYEEALSLKPDNADAYNKMGLVLKDQGKFKDAIAAYTKALAINPDFSENRTDLAILLFDIGKFEEAIQLFSMDNSIRSQTRLLKCYYELDKKSKLYKQLDSLIERGENNCVIGSYTSRSEIRYGVKRQNPFCNDPLKYVKKTDLTKKCNFKKTFVENATNVLSNDQVKHKSQGHLTNGIQTSGNIFTQVGSVTNLWQDVIRAELTNYKGHFCDSKEGFIKDWPSDYSLYGWLVSMKNGGELSAHIHDTGWVTGSIYINVPTKSKKDSGNLVVATHDPKDGKQNTKDIKSLDVVTGSLCFFPSSLLHYTIPFESNEDRIVLAFDVIPN